MTGSRVRRKEGRRRCREERRGEGTNDVRAVCLLGQKRDVREDIKRRDVRRKDDDAARVPKRVSLGEGEKGIGWERDEPLLALADGLDDFFHATLEVSGLGGWRRRVKSRAGRRCDGDQEEVSRATLKAHERSV